MANDQNRQTGKDSQSNRPSQAEGERNRSGMEEDPTRQGQSGQSGTERSGQSGTDRNQGSDRNTGSDRDLGESGRTQGDRSTNEQERKASSVDRDSGTSDRNMGSRQGSNER